MLCGTRPLVCHIRGSPRSRQVPTLDELVAMAEAAAPPAVRAARARAASDTTQPHAACALELCDEAAARSALDEYVRTLQYQLNQEVAETMSTSRPIEASSK